MVGQACSAEGEATDMFSRCAHSRRGDVMGDGGRAPDIWAGRLIISPMKYPGRNGIY